MTLAGEAGAGVPYVAGVDRPLVTEQVTAAATQGCPRLICPNPPVRLKANCIADPGRVAALRGLSNCAGEVCAELPTFYGGVYRQRYRTAAARWTLVALDKGEPRNALAQAVFSQHLAQQLLIGVDSLLGELHWQVGQRCCRRTITRIHKLLMRPGQNFGSRQAKPVYCQVSAADQFCERLPEDWAASLEMHGMRDQIPV